MTILSGVLEYNLLLFFIGMFVSRLTFFAMFAVAIWFYGDNIRLFIEKHLPLATGILLFFIIVDWSGSRFSCDGAKRLLRPGNRSMFFVCNSEPNARCRIRATFGAAPSPPLKAWSA